MNRSRAYRIHQVERVIRTRLGLVRRLGNNCVRHVRQLAIRHPYDCGKTDCPLCCRFHEKEDHKRKQKDRTGFPEDADATGAGT